MSTALDLDIAALVGDMPAIPCESAGHSEISPNHGGHATRYAEGTCPGCGRYFFKAYCAPFVAYVSTPNHRVECADCGHHYHAAEVMTILGPVGGRTS